VTTDVLPLSRLTSGADLPTRLANDLRARLVRHEWRTGERMPTEAELVAGYGVSRATVREAMKSLEGEGLVVTRQGRGSFVAPHSLIRAGMQDLKSITATIAEMGHEPGMEYHHRVVRASTREDQEMFDLAPGDLVVDIRRRIIADGVTVAYSYDVLPRWVFPASFEPEELTGSVFGHLAAHGGPVPDRAVAQVHAVQSAEVAWDQELDEHHLFVLLDQLQFDRDGRPFMHTRSYFIEGRFSFTVIRKAR
jgi:GntR family transcriptional regulator